MRKIAITIYDITLQAGTERAVCNLVNLLVEYGGYDPKIISISSRSGRQQYHLLKEPDIYHLNIDMPKDIFKKLGTYHSIINKIREIDKTERFDIIIGTATSINVLLTFIRKGVEVIGCEHINYNATSVYSKILKKIFYSRLNALVVLTLIDSMHYNFVKNIVVIPNSLSFSHDEVAALTARRVLAIGRLTYQKGFDMLITAISMIKEVFQGWEVRIIGDGEDKNSLNKQIQDLGVGNIVRIYPPTSNIVDEYLSASIFVLSSRYEGFGLVLIEAQSCGLPIVSFNCPEGPSEIIINNRNGLLIEDGNIQQMASAMTELMLNPEKRRLFGINALEDSNRYKPEKIFALWDNLLNTL